MANVILSATYNGVDILPYLDAEQVQAALERLPLWAETVIDNTGGVGLVDITWGHELVLLPAGYSLIRQEDTCTIDHVRVLWWRATVAAAARWMWTRCAAMPEPRHRKPPD